MSFAMTAEDMFDQVKKMPTKERVKFFSLIAINAFQENNFTHEQVFGHLRNDTFSAEEAAEYLEVSMPTFRRYVQSGKIKPKEVIGRSQLFGTIDLRKLKQKLG
ncbi:helix-turn-helix domain-containing protein [Polynucleobacter sp. 31A-FELB]|jgi:excisionase family DNA binding protein|uniref:helix-turn-helix domain-containing protein n=1 Tax=Polynucleobacter sp. 31A-FELB TaxID=2689096 RepID=UPI001DFDB4ED|nr:helix-turn-helix domain-containing protein [Polynucleobacter sp. 31A-FELB]MBU3587852.1 helix-turn-helix domain-containing protein [Polynucleobacter sp. 31A-FELB]